MQIPGDRKGRAMYRQGFQRKCHPVMILGYFVRVFTMFCQGISIPHTSQPLFACSPYMCPGTGCFQVWAPLVACFAFYSTRFQ
eukprot:398486-Pelagomonas_calceolata.AAC.1